MPSKTIVVDFNKTLELDGNPNTVLVKRLQEESDRQKSLGTRLSILILTGEKPEIVHEFLHKNKIMNVFLSVLTKPHMVKCDLYIDDNEELLAAVKGRYATEALNVAAISLNSPEHLLP